MLMRPIKEINRQIKLMLRANMFRIKRQKPHLLKISDDGFLTFMSQRFSTDRAILAKLVERVPERELMVEVGSLAGF